MEQKKKWCVIHVKNIIAKIVRISFHYTTNFKEVGAMSVLIRVENIHWIKLK